MKKSTIPSRSPFAVLRQICSLIPGHLVPKLARETGVNRKARTFSGPAFSACRSCCRFHHHPTGRFLHGLGQTPSAQGGSQVSFAVDCVAGLCAPEIPCLYSWVASQLYPHFYPDTQCPLAPMGPGKPPSILWDSIRRLPLYSHPAAALFSGVLNIPVGQPHS